MNNTVEQPTIANKPLIKRNTPDLEQILILEQTYEQQHICVNVLSTYLNTYLNT